MGTQLLVTLATNGYSDASRVFSTGERNLRELVFIVWGFVSNSSPSKASKLKCLWRGQSYLQRSESWNGEGEGWSSQPCSKFMVLWVLSCTCGVILWMYFSGAIARLLLQLHWRSCRQGRSASPVEANFPPVTKIQPRIQAVTTTQAALPSAGCISAQPRGSPAAFLQAHHPQQPGLLRHRAPCRCYSWKDDKASKQQPTACLWHGPLHEEQHSMLPWPQQKTCLAEV